MNGLAFFGVVLVAFGVAWTPAAAVLGYPAWSYPVLGACVGLGACLLALLVGEKR